MTAQEALEFIHSRSWLGSRLGLERIRELMHRLGDPQEKLRFVHVAGTNGKGSSSAMLAGVLRAAGLRTGLCISPYVLCFNERMQIDGAFISDEELARITALVAPQVLAMEDRPTEFEVVTAIALTWFYQENCDIVVLEVGMGGRLDSTNVIPPAECSLLCNIGLDHTRQLGTTVEEIAREKAGIIKPGTRAVLYPSSPGVQALVSDICREKDVPLRISDFAALVSVDDSRDGQSFTYRGAGPYRLPMLGRHQLQNAAGVLEAVEVLRGRGWGIPDRAVREGLASVVWPARFEIVSRRPWFVIDGGHNPQCAETVAANLRHYFPDTPAVILTGILADKDYEGLTDIIAPCAESFVTVTPPSPRALPAVEYARHLAGYGKSVYACDSIGEGVRLSLDLAGKDGLVCAVGSLYIAGEIRRFFIDTPCPDRRKEQP